MTSSLQLVSNVTVNDVELSTSSYMNSMHFMKNLLKTSIVNIMYNRIEHDDDLFRSYNLRDVPYKGLSSKIPKSHVLQRVNCWMKDVSVVLENKKLNNVYLVIMNEEKSITEYYEFTIKYLKEPATAVNVEEVFQLTEDFIKTINLLGINAKLPQNTECRMQMTISDNLNLKHFQTGLLVQNGDYDIVTMGSINTGYNKLRLCAKGQIFTESDNSSLQLIDEHEDTLSQKENQVICTCGINVNFNGVPLIKCIKCEAYQHMPCNGYKVSNPSKDNYTCWECCKLHRIQSHDKRMASFNKNVSKEVRLAICRLISYSAVYTNVTPQQIIDKISPVFVKATVDFFQKIQILKFNNNTYLPNTSQMKSLVDSRFFYQDTDNDVLDEVEIIETED